jgi:hypothetical protein
MRRYKQKFVTTDENNVMVNSKELISTRDYMTL